MALTRENINVLRAAYERQAANQKAAPIPARPVAQPAGKAAPVPARPVATPAKPVATPANAPSLTKHVVNPTSPTPAKPVATPANIPTARPVAKPVGTFPPGAFGGKTPAKPVATPAANPTAPPPPVATPAKPTAVPVRPVATPAQPPQVATPPTQPTPSRPADRQFRSPGGGREEVKKDVRDHLFNAVHIAGIAAGAFPNTPAPDLRGRGTPAPREASDEVSVWTGPPLGGGGYGGSYPSVGGSSPP